MRSIGLIVFHPTPALLRTPEQIFTDNRAFQALTARQKRLQIATDVLQYLDDNIVIKPRHSGYFSLYLNHGDSQAVQSEVILNTTAERCQVCAKGALLITKVRNYNGYRINRFSDEDEHVFRGLRGIFSTAQLDLIESAYERIPRRDTELRTSKAVDDAATEMYKDFGSMYVDDSKTLRSIMENITGNDGDFIVPGFTARQCGVRD